MRDIPTTESEQPEEKKPVGRPTDYDPIYCEKVIELGKLGKSFEQMCGLMNVGYTTMRRWRDAHEEFRLALEDAHALSQNWWEDMAQSYMVEAKDGERLNTGLWSRSMAARFPKNYSDRIKQEITGAGGAPLITNVEITLVDTDGSKSAD